MLIEVYLTKITNIILLVISHICHAIKILIVTRLFYHNTIDSKPNSNKNNNKNKRYIIQFFILYTWGAFLYTFDQNLFKLCYAKYYGIRYINAISSYEFIFSPLIVELLKYIGIK